MTTGSGILTLGGNVTANASATPASILGNLDLGSATRTFNVANGAADPDTIDNAGGTLNVTSSFTANTGKVFNVTANQTGTMDINGGATLTLGNAANVLTTSDTNGILNKNGAGFLDIPNANTSFDGTLQINAGTVQVQNAQSLGDATNRGRVTFSGGTLDLRNNAATSFSNNISVTADSTINVDRLTTGTDLTHTLGTLSIGANTLTVAGGNSFNLTLGATTLSGAATINTATSGTDVTVGAVSGAVQLGSGTLSAGGNNSSTSFSGTISGTGGSFVKQGAGTMTIPGSNTYTGATTIANGTLAFGGTTIGGTPTSTLFLGSTATLGTLHITGDTILDFGNSSASTLDTTNFKIDSGVRITIMNWVESIDYFNAQNWLAGTTPPNLGDRGVGDQLQIAFDGFNNNSTAWLQYGAEKHITPTPEPATYGAMMIGAALAFTGFRRWRKTRVTKT